LTCRRLNCIAVEGRSRCPTGAGVEIAHTMPRGAWFCAADLTSFPGGLGRTAELFGQGKSLHSSHEVVNVSSRGRRQGPRGSRRKLREREPERSGPGATPGKETIRSPQNVGGCRTRHSKTGAIFDFGGDRDGCKVAGRSRVPGVIRGRLRAAIAARGKRRRSREPHTVAIPKRFLPSPARRGPRTGGVSPAGGFVCPGSMVAQGFVR